MWRRRRKIPVPVVNPQAAQNYLARKLDDHEWMKKAPKEELVAHCRDDLRHRFTQAPWHNQLVAFALASAYRNFLFAVQMGGGKTSTALQSVRFRKRRGELGSAIAVVPYLLHVASWEDQIRAEAPDLTYRLLVGDRDERERLLRTPVDVCVINHAGLQVYMTQRVLNKKTKKPEYAIDKKRAAEFAAIFNMMLLDECQYFGSHRSLYFDMAWWLSCAADFRYAFTGTLFGKDPTKAWSQFLLVDQGETLGSTLGVFRNVFFDASEDKWAGLKWKFREEMVPELSRVMRHRSISYTAEELRDMPRKLYLRIPVRLQGEGEKQYRRTVQGLAEARGDYRSLENVYVRMRQCASGYVSLRADDESRIDIRFKENPKLDALHDLVLSKPDEKVLVFHEFRPSGFFIEEMLRQARVPFASLRGQMKDPGAEYHRFLHDPKCRIFVLNNKLGSENINPQYVCRRAVFYESSDDPIKRSQAESRVWRSGQEWPCFIHDIVALGTVEEKIIKYNRAGASLLRAVMTGEEMLEEGEE